MFDPQIFCHQRFGGISRYVCGIANEMQGMSGVTPLIVAPFHFNEYLDALPRTLVHGKRVRWLEGFTALAYGASVLPAKFDALRFKPNVLHNTYYFPVKPPRGAATVVTVHDMIHEKYPECFASSPLITRLKAASVAMADHVVCVSEATRRDLLAMYDVSENRLSVIHLGFEPLRTLLGGDSPSAFKVRVLGTDSPYLLYVGSRVSYKNFKGLLGAYAASPWLRHNFFLLCFGGGKFTHEEQAAISAVGAENRVRHLGGGDAVLAACYAYASVFVYPSFYEGFGLPLLEAMSLDCPVACSNSSSLPEVAGDAARLFDPLDCDSIGCALESVLASATEADELVQRGRIRSRQFSWRRCAEATIDAYSQI